MTRRNTLPKRTRCLLPNLAQSLLTVLVLAGCEDEDFIGCWTDAEADSDEPDAELSAHPDDARGREVARSDGGSSAAKNPATGPNACSVSMPAADWCKIENGASLPEDLTVDALGGARFFAAGAALPPGRYGISYVGGCISFEPSGRGWAVHGLAVDRTLASLATNGESACWLIGEGNSLIAPAPGLAWRAVLSDAGPVGHYDTLAECERANCGLPSLEFDFAGGRLGVRFGNSTSYVRLSGENVGGRSPTFRLTRLDPCD